jgi:hypothetical protein
MTAAAVNIAASLVARVSEVHFFLNSFGFALIFAIQDGDHLRRIDALRAVKSSEHAAAVARAVLDAVSQCQSDAQHCPKLFCDGVRVAPADVSRKLTRPQSAVGFSAA